MSKPEFVAVNRKHLEALEWSSYKRGQGTGYMGSGGNGRLIPACPVCRQCKDTPEAKGEFIASAIGHDGDCWLGNALKKMEA